MMTEQILENKVNYKVDHDGLWKNIITELFKEFMEFFAPELYKQIDFTKEADFLQQELYEKILNKEGRKYADLIVKVRLKNGEEKHILVHIEVQAIGGEEFAERMFRYFYRIYDIFDLKIHAIALLTDATHKTHHDTFHYSFHGTNLTYHYNTYNFHGKDPEKLKQSSNPFALAVAAGIYASKSRNDDEKRYEFKEELIKLVLEKYSNKDNIYASALVYFIDYLLKIPEEMKKKLYVELEPIIEKEEARLVGMERLKDTPTIGMFFQKEREEGRNEGREEGRKEAEIELAKNLLRDHFSDEKVSRLTGLDIEEIRKLKQSLES